MAEPASTAVGLPDGAQAAAHLVRLLGERGLHLATAESLTGGLLAGAVTDVPGASRVFVGGVVAYATPLKHALLGVDADLLDRVGAVDPEVAAQMADGVRRRLGADVGLATTGVAGPDPQDGHAPGTVFVGVATPEAVRSVEVSLAPADVGGRAQVRAHTVHAALQALVDALGG
ncbi:MAG TPA: nicotinamide-nucleotide amidohydrolase family protein [Angustibacter sp.]|nr:nicotinamide-nucleotide amidohydrolase family protein [Angustibacter sp.]